MLALDLSCSELPEEFSALVKGHLEGAAKALDLAADFHHIEICADDFSGQDGAWFSFHSQVEGNNSRVGAILYCSSDVFCKSRFASPGLMPGVEIWEQLPVQALEPGLIPGEFSGQEADSFLYHNLILAQDLVLESLNMTAIPNSMAQAFAMAWSVTIDGRLSRLGLPGYSLLHRRGRFSRLFSSVGVLLPGHWDIFQSLWDGALTASAEVLSASRQLPRLRP
ncbi:MAG: hypothetical protein KOO60_06740 [Gemmatimonadales bacterium]|nr:hypothetical protein [Gemmatimonadales bacterium]